MIVERRTTAEGLASRHRAALTARLQEQADTYRHTAEVLTAAGDYEHAQRFWAEASRLSAGVRAQRG